MVGLSEKERNRKLVNTVFRGRCALNLSHPGAHIHEIVPRSVRPGDWWKLGNQVLLCPECHDKIHREGTKKYREQLLGLVWTKILQSEEVTFPELIEMLAS